MPVMPALVAGINVFGCCRKEDVDGRNKSGHDGEGPWSVAPGIGGMKRPRTLTRHARACRGHPRLS